ncbi:MAG: hypothetical protein SGI92_01230 [Bryobacteraceae bacterium]|nr:hypothetical protein [Bryobacteraceae bacterium]
MPEPLLSRYEVREHTSPLFRWLFHGNRLDVSHPYETAAHPWYSVLWLTGVDYFSTLGYQPGIALLAAGAISPIATGILVLVTLFCALPVYSQVAGRSYVGQGSIAMLENLLQGWWGKLFVLVLLGFAATDFVITMTLSAADATQHAMENPFLHPYLADARMILTLGLLAMLGAVFLAGFNEAIGLAAFVAIPYILLNVVVLVRAFIEIWHHPEALPNWQAALMARGTDWGGILLAAAIIFPRLALGLSGFETGVSVMPLIQGEVPHGRVANTRKLLAAAALIMSVLLVASSFATTLLIPESAYKAGGKASGRAIAYLAHGLLGDVFGTVYDASTILILWFAGASAMAGLLHLIPRYLPRFGMAPMWVAYPRPLVLVLFSIAVVVTIVFRADVEAQGGAYATGVLVLMLSASIAAAIALGHEHRRGMSIYAWVVAAIFAYTLVDNVHERPDGIIIASIFILLTLTVSGVSRYIRATELRVSEICFTDPESEELWQSILCKKVNLAPLRTLDDASCEAKEREIRKHYIVDGPVAFLNVGLVDNRSEFLAPLRVQVLKQGGHYAIHVSGANATANTIAYISELVDPISIFLGLTRLPPVTQAIRFLLFGEGEVGLLVYTILLRYWEMTPEEDVRPNIFLMSN